MSSISSRNIVKMSAAGSGKTYDICKEALMCARLGQRVLITTYTNRGADSIRKEIRLQNDGVLHPLVVIKTWLSFLLSDMIKPYQHYITKEIGKIKSFDYSQTYGVINYAKAGSKTKYITEANNVRLNEGASLVCLINDLSNGKTINRLEHIYSTIYFDEIQDLAGDDITIIKMLIESSISIVCCGDNKQATFSTHNAKKYKKKTGKNIWEFFKELEDKGLVKVEHNLASRRFNKQICCFANRVFPVGDSITTIMNYTTQHDGVYLIAASDMVAYYNKFSPQVLRYDKRTPTNNLFAINFGACKGETFDRVMILANGPLVRFITNEVRLDSAEKYYVAVTRPRFSIAIVLPNLPSTLNGYKETFIDCNGIIVRTLKYNLE